MAMEAIPVSIRGDGAARPRREAVALEPGEVALLQACVGFHAKAQADPGIRQRLYQLWCKLEDLKGAA